MEKWPPILRSMCNLIVAKSDPAAIFWGPNSTMIYNEAFISMAGKQHPALLGQRPSGFFAEVWDDHFKSMTEQCRKSGIATKKDNLCLFLGRHGFPEEVYVSFTYAPIIGEDGAIVGNFHTVKETTSTVLADRQMKMLLGLAQLVSSAKDLKGYWQRVQEALTASPNDVPFALLYSVARTTALNTQEADSEHRTCTFEGSIGISSGHGAAPAAFDLCRSQEGFAPAFREAARADRAILLQAEDGSLPEDLITGSADIDWKGFGEPCRSAIVCPLRPTNGENTVGFLVLGLNPRRPYDDDYRTFIELLSRHLTTSLAAVVLYEEEIRRGRTAAERAAADRAELATELALRLEESRKNEQRFATLTKYAPVGIFIMAGDGCIEYANDEWYRISSYDGTGDPWESLPIQEDEHIAREMFEKLQREKTITHFEIRLRTPWKPPYETVPLQHTWCLVSIYPEFSANKEILGFAGCVTDISQQKWAEELQAQKVQGALDAKRQHENFIDMTFHEIRNPLSAIMQCADGIVTSNKDKITARVSAGAAADELMELMESNVDAAQTIVYCALHQKHVIDDILTLSKLDSDLLLITPIMAEPEKLVQQALKIFEVQSAAADIQLSTQTRPSFTGFEAQSVLLDPSRLLQVLINLISNAIKFTETQKVRQIKVILGASLERPTARTNDEGIQYIDAQSSGAARKTQLAQTEEDIYLTVSVTDTGCGLSTEEQHRLFRRFSQASPRTHIQYGGSGLGLFISRRLIELQGGEIGVASTPGLGSTFAFYIRARKPLTLSAPVGPPRRPSALARENSQPIAQHGHQISQSTRKVSCTPTTNNKTAARQLHVLVVEDNIVNQKVLTKQLRKLSCVVDTASNGQEALSHIRTTRLWKDAKSDKDLSVILMDVEMPIMDGLACARAIRRLELAGNIVGHVPIIAVTANARLEQLAQARESGMVRDVRLLWYVVLTGTFRMMYCRSLFGLMTWSL